MDKQALAALAAIGGSLTVGEGEKTFTEVQRESDSEERAFDALVDRLKEAMGSYQHTMWLLDGEPEGKHGTPEYIDRLVVLGKLEASDTPAKFVEEFEAKVEELKAQLEEMEKNEGTLDGTRRRRRSW